MDEASVEAMLSEASINKKNARILFHLNQFFGAFILCFKTEIRTYFSDCDFSPPVDEEVLPDKMIIPFTYKGPHLLLQNQASKMLQNEDFCRLISVELAVGGNSGGGYFRMMLKVLFHLNDITNASHIFQSTSMSFLKDVIKILKRTVLDRIGSSLKLIVDGGNFTVHKLQGSSHLELSFESIERNNAVCGAPI
jgi:hypothetical protein